MIKYRWSAAAYGLIAVPLREMERVGVRVAKDESKRMRIVSLLLGLQKVSVLILVLLWVRIRIRISFVCTGTAFCCRIRSWFHLDSLENLGLLNRTVCICNRSLLLSLADAGGRLMYAYKDLQEVTGLTGRHAHLQRLNKTLTGFIKIGQSFCYAMLQ
ncbi:uncharacterized protein EDB91DRAFT_48170 [Suillus paluster]|uniref:uncharacterized protein n=1 Tax=Suillus paluster TaxID=48578 RepID=UPI001B874B1E|nr:uncharacterized protein EDB91DRAFT_48170 [Suillus paluster]KAG1747866.1 hypothetical protein EDB91DRAFT_48170 [Suillus paluster]